MNWKTSGLRHTSALSLGNSRLPFNNPLLFVIPSAARNLQCALIPPQFLRATMLPIPTEPICLRPHFVHEERLTCLWASQRWNELEDIGSLRHTVLSLGNSPLPFNNPL